MLIALTGTPGTGKTTVSVELRSRGYEVIDSKSFLKEHGLLGDKDVPRDTYNVDMDEFNEALEEFRVRDGPVVLDSHLGHGTDCSMIIVLRCNPDVLAERLRARGYSEAKVKENVQAEVLDVILCEATDTDIPVYEIDCTEGTPSDAVDLIVRILNGDTEICSPGQTDWSEGMEKWF